METPPKEPTPPSSREKEVVDRLFDSQLKMIAGGGVLGMAFYSYSNLIRDLLSPERQIKASELCCLALPMTVVGLTLIGVGVQDNDSLIKESLDRVIKG